MIASDCQSIEKEENCGKKIFVLNFLAISWCMSLINIIQDYFGKAGFLNVTVSITL